MVAAVSYCKEHASEEPHGAPGSTSVHLAFTGRSGWTRRWVSHERELHLCRVRDTVPPNLTAVLAPNRATRPYLPRRSSNRVMLKQNLASKSRQIDGDFCSGAGPEDGTIVGIG